MRKHKYTTQDNTIDLTSVVELQEKQRVKAYEPFETAKKYMQVVVFDYDTSRKNKEVTYEDLLTTTEIGIPSSIAKELIVIAEKMKKTYSDAVALYDKGKPYPRWFFFSGDGYYIEMGDFPKGVYSLIFEKIADHEN